MNTEIKVSVCVVTYNQEKYIEQCINSILVQNTKYAYEIIIGDDASKDGTRDILMRLKQSNPDIITLLLHKENIGASENVLSVYRHAKGEYIAHLDGDDYFLPGKIEKQIGVMEEDQNCGMSFHSVYGLNRSGEIRPENFDFDLMPNEGWRRSDLIQLMAIGVNSSKIFRRELLSNLPKISFPLIDTVFNCMIIGNFNVKYVKSSPLGVYRLGVGVASSGDSTRQAFLEGYDYLSDFLPSYERKYLCAAVFIMLLIDLKNWRSKPIIFYRLWLKCFDFRFLFLFLKKLRYFYKASKRFK